MISRRHLASLLGARLLARDLRLSRFEIHSVRIPFHQRVREAWLSSWKNQKRDQSDYTLQFVRLHTADGLTGIGEAKMPRPQAEALLRSMMGRPAADFANDDSLRGISIAIADILAQAASQPISKLLNPNAQAHVTPTWWSQCFPPAVMASEAKLGASFGYRVHKVKARPWEDPIRQAEAICAVVPKDFKIWVDANSTWATADKTLAIAAQLRRFPHYFAIESPIARTDTAGYRALRGKLPFLLAEHIDAAEPTPLMRENLLDAWIVAAPKLTTYLRNLVGQSRAARRPIWIEHSIDNGIAQVFQSHQAAAWPELQYVIAITHVLEDDCMREPYTVTNGRYAIPNRPGLGVTLDEAALDKYRI